MIRSTTMKPESRSPLMSKLVMALPAIAAAGLLALTLPVACQKAQEPAPGPAAKAFDSPQQAAEALIAAAEKFDEPALEEIFGPDGRDLILTGEEALDRQKVAAFAALARQKNGISVDPKDPKVATLIVGEEDWPLPVRIVKRGRAWSFDAATGRQEILF